MSLPFVAYVVLPPKMMSPLDATVTLPCTTPDTSTSTAE